MSELLFFMFNYKGNTKPYYRQNDKILDYFNQEITSQDIIARILDSDAVKYFRFNEILKNIESVPIVTNLIYMDDVNFHSTHVILSTTNTYSLKVLVLEDLQAELSDYVPYDTFLLYPFPSPNIHHPFNVFLLSSLKRQNKPRLVQLANESNLRVEQITVQPDIGPRIDPKTGFPEFVLIHGLRVGFIRFSEFKRMYRAKKIFRYMIDENVQKLAQNPNTFITVFGVNGITYLLNAFYDKEKNLIHPPK